MKFFLTFSLLLAAFVCINADLEQVYKDVEDEMRAFRVEQAPEWKNIEAGLLRNKSDFEKLVQEEKKSGKVDKEELTETLTEQLEQYQDDTAQLVDEYETLMKQVLDKMYAELPKFNMWEQILLKKEFDLIIEENTYKYSEIFKPVNELAIKNYMEGNELVESL